TAIVLIGLFVTPFVWNYRGKFLGSVPGDLTAAPATLFITDIENQTGDAFFDSTVRVLLNLGLMQSPQIYVVCNAQIGTLLRGKKSTDGKLNLATAQQLAAQQPLSRILDVKVIGAANGYEIVSYVFEGASGKRTASEREVFAAKSNLPAAISALS